MISKKYGRTEFLCIFLAIMFSSMLGAQFLGISLNKIALIPLVVFLALKQRTLKFRVNAAKKSYLLWVILQSCSALLSFRITTNAVGFASDAILTFIQVYVFYIPIALMIDNIEDPVQIMKKAVLIVCKIQACWGIAQYILWVTIKLNLNQLIFVDVLNAVFGTNWNAWLFDTNLMSKVMRVTGLNHDPAYLSLILFVGFCFESNVIWKIIYFCVCILATSRSGIVVIIFAELYFWIKSYKKITVKQFVAFGLSSFLILGVMLYIYQKSPDIQYQASILLNRLNEVIRIVGGSSTSSGTLRHMLYIPTAFKVWFFDFDPLSKIFGIGPGSGGVAFSMYAGYTIARAWVIECDIAEMLMGNGIISLILMYIIYMRIAKKGDIKIKACIWGLILYGFMYDVFETTLVQIFIICLLGTSNIKQMKQ